MLLNKELLEYVDNGNLFSFIKSNNKLTELEAYKLFVQIVSAVRLLHENNFIHRDLKPENILLDKDQSVKVCDFGWSTHMAVGNRATFCGTFEYMAPELIQELPYDKSIDIWSLGVLLYELVHGKSPFCAKQNVDQKDIFANILERNIVFDPECSSSFQQLVNWMLAKKPENRPTIEELQLHRWMRLFGNKVKKSKLSTNDLAKLIPVSSHMKTEFASRESNLLNKVIKKLETKRPKKEVGQSDKKKNSKLSETPVFTKTPARNSSAGAVKKIKTEVEIDLLTLDSKHDFPSSRNKLALNMDDMKDTISILESATSKRGETAKESTDKGFWSAVGEFFTPFKCGKDI